MLLHLPVVVGVVWLLVQQRAQLGVKKIKSIKVGGPCCQEMWSVGLR